MKVWALTTPPGMRTSKNAAKMLTSIVVCDECKDNVHVSHIITPEGKALLNALGAAHARAPHARSFWKRIAQPFSKVGRAWPDYDSIVLDFQEIIDEPVDLEREYRAQR